MSQSSQPYGRVHEINPVREDGTIVCHCNIPAPRRTSYTPKNPNRDFYGCVRGRDDPDRCKFFMWADDPRIVNHPAHQPVIPSTPTSTPSKSQPNSQPEPTSAPRTPQVSGNSLKRPLSPSSPSPSTPVNIMPPVTPARAAGPSNAPRTPAAHSTPQAKASRLKEIYAALGQPDPQPSPSPVAQPHPLPVAPTHLDGQCCACGDEHEHEHGLEADHPADRVAAGMQTDFADASSQSLPQSQVTDEDGDEAMADYRATFGHSAALHTPPRGRSESARKRARIRDPLYPSLEDSMLDHTSELLTPPSTTGNGLSASAGRFHPAMERLGSPTPSSRNKGKGKARALFYDDQEEAEMNANADMSVPGAYDNRQDDDLSSTREVESLLASHPAHIPHTHTPPSPSVSQLSFSHSHLSRGGMHWNARNARALVEQLQDLPAYIDLLERKKYAAEKSCEVKARRIGELEGTVEKMKERMKILEERNSLLETTVEALKAAARR